MTQNVDQLATGRYLPVEIPQLSKQALSMGRSGVIFTTLATSITVYSEKLETYTKWCRTSPFKSLNLLVLSLGMTWINLLSHSEQLLLFFDLQSLHSPQFDKNTGTTLSPSFTSSTCSPTLSTTLHSYAHTKQKHDHVMYTHVPCQRCNKFTNELWTIWLLRTQQLRARKLLEIKWVPAGEVHTFWIP